jgi:hypothetical protein
MKISRILSAGGNHMNATESRFPIVDGMVQFGDEVISADEAIRRLNEWVDRISPAGMVMASDTEIVVTAPPSDAILLRTTYQLPPQTNERGKGLQEIKLP